MNENENLVLEGTENVGATTTEEVVEQVEPAKVYTEEEFNTKLNEVSGKRAARKETKIRKEYDRKYGGLIDVLKAGTGIDDVEELTNTFKDHYAQRGVQFATEPKYSKRDIEVLAQAEADDIIKAGFDEVIEEADRLNELGVENMTARDKAVFVALTNHIKSTETSRELSKIGVGEDVYNSKDFNDFASKFNSNTPIKEIYEIYNKTQPKKEIKTMGSIKNTTADNNAVKDFYTPEEARKFTLEDFKRNPALYEAIDKSRLKWK